MFASVVERYSIGKEGTVEEAEEDDIEIEKILTADALMALEMALETVRLWEMQQEDGQAWTLQALTATSRSTVEKAINKNSEHGFRKRQNTLYRNRPSLLPSIALSP